MTPPPPAVSGIAYHAQPFDSGLLGTPIGRLVLAPETTEPEARAAIAAFRERWRKEGVCLVSSRVPDTAGALCGALEDAGFYQVEALVTYRRSVQPVPDVGAAVTTATPADADACARIAGAAFVYDRYHADPAIPDAAADAVKAAWARNAVAGRADAVLVVRVADRVHGFVSCMLEDDEAIVDLIAVALDAQRRGYARALVAGALRHYADRALALRASTQEANTPSTALYQRMGFAEVGRARTFHWRNPDVQP